MKFQSLLFLLATGLVSSVFGDQAYVRSHARDLRTVSHTVPREVELSDMELAQLLKRKKISLPKSKPKLSSAKPKPKPKPKTSSAKPKSKPDPKPKPSNDKPKSKPSTEHSSKKPSSTKAHDTKPSSTTQSSVKPSTTGHYTSVKTFNTKHSSTKPSGTGHHTNVKPSSTTHFSSKPSHTKLTSTKAEHTTHVGTKAAGTISSSADFVSPTAAVEAPANETPDNDAPVHETSDNETPVHETSDNETPVHETSDNETPDHDSGTPDNETPDHDSGTPDNETPANIAPSMPANADPSRLQVWRRLDQRVVAFPDRQNSDGVTIKHDGMNDLIAKDLCGKHVDLIAGNPSQGFWNLEMLIDATQIQGRWDEIYPKGDGAPIKVESWVEEFEDDKVPDYTWLGPLDQALGAPDGGVDADKLEEMGWEEIEGKTYNHQSYNCDTFVRNMVRKLVKP